MVVLKEKETIKDEVYNILLSWEIKYILDNITIYDGTNSKIISEIIMAKLRHEKRTKETLKHIKDLSEDDLNLIYNNLQDNKDKKIKPLIGENKVIFMLTLLRYWIMLNLR